MGSLKTYALAGLLSVVSSAALAADLMPAPVLAPPPVPVEVGGGWYLRGDVGVGHLELRRFEGTDTPGYPQPVGGFQAEQKAIGDQAFAGAGVGYRVNNWLRFDGTAEYRTSTSVRFAESYSTGGFLFDQYGKSYGTRGLDFYSGHLSSIVAMANVYVDLGTWYGITPFIGAGVGGAFHHLYGLTDFGAGVDGNGFPIAGAAGVVGDKNSTSLAWALHAGLAYSVTPNLTLELGYRYLNMGEVESGRLSCYNTAGNCPGTTYKLKELDSHDIKIGMRWALGGVAATPVFAEAPIMPAPAPLVRKY